MNWEAVGAIGEILGAAAVVATLLYLSIQTRLNRKAMEASSVQEIFDSFSSVNRSVIDSEEIAILYEKGLRNPASLTHGESLRFFMLLREACNGYWGMFNQYKNGHVDEKTWKIMRFDIFASTPGGNEFIQEQKHIWDDDFRNYIDSMEKFSDGDPVKLLVGGRAGDT